MDIKMNIVELSDNIKNKKISVRELALYCLSLIFSKDQCKNGYNSVLEINPEVLFLADSLDDLQHKGNDLGPLHGIPILLKDNINTGDKMPTSAGSLALKDNYAKYDAHLVSRLRRGGALILGNTNMTEFANYMTNDMPNGYSSRGGFVNSATQFNPSGSSTGSAVAVATGLCPAAIGTENIGSIISPALNNMIVGVKPTTGLISRHGVIPISTTYDTPGPMARCVMDAAILLGVMSGRDEKDPATFRLSDKTYDFHSGLKEGRLNGIRVGIADITNDPDLDDPEFVKAIDRIIRILEERGASCVPLQEYSLSLDRAGDISRYEFKNAMNSYLSLHNPSYKIRTLEDIIRYNQDHVGEALRFGQSTLLDIQNNTSGTQSEMDYLLALVEREAAISEYDKLFDDNGVDVIFSLTHTGDNAVTGFPCMTMPIGTPDFPIGSHWMAQKYKEQVLLKTAYSVEMGL